MSRPIKFRAWDERNKIMHYDFQFIKSGDEGNDWIIFISDKFPLTNHKTNPFENPSPYFSQQLKVMQFTGLLDKNGKEIYEGDVVKILDRYEYPDEEPKEYIRIGEVYYKQSDCRFCLKDRIEFELEGTTIEILGNIYENSDLLANAKKEG